MSPLPEMNEAVQPPISATEARRPPPEPSQSALASSVRPRFFSESHVDFGNVASWSGVHWPSSARAGMERTASAARRRRAFVRIA
jgi:hypothetical protein